jgi:diaminohydroxyphosphoribosylaminopyrimidine deaminase/5-amino-6-(5-phosphoribosylamino)uracil reductase
VLEAECQDLNEAFAKYITRRLPFVTLKLAASLDGKIAAVSGDARWISDSVSRTAVHRLRNRMDAVLVGADTVLKDDPQLTCRIGGGRNPWRVVLDGRLRIPLTARFLRQPEREKNVVVTSRRAPARKVRALEALGVKVWQFPARAGEIPWRAFLERLAYLGIVSVLVEGGAKVASSALRQRAVDKVMFFYAAKIIGGDGRVMIDSLGTNRVRNALAVHRVQVEKSGGDVLVTGYIRKDRIRAKG